MFQVVLFILSVAFASVTGWAECDLDYREGCYSYQIAMCIPSGSSESTSCTCDQMCTDGTILNGWYVTASERRNEGGTWRCYFKRCRTACQMDSVLYYDACINAGNTWNSQTCQCNETSRDTTITYCINLSMTSTTDVVGAGGLTYQQITKQPAHEIRVCHCKVKNGSITECEGKTGNIDVGTDCPVSERSLGTCNDSGKPDGPQPDNSGGNTNPAFVPANCFAVTGSTCHMTRPSTSETWTCDCDGSCDYAMNQYLTGGGDCYKPRSSSSYSPFSSSSRSSSSTSNPESSSTDTPQSSGSGGGGETGIYMDVLQAIQANTYGTMQNTYDISQWTQATMNNTTDIKNELSNIGVDVSHIRDNTLETANNTGMIANHTGSMDNKLNTTNSLLNDIKNKNWNPNINVNVERDTNIINVAGDTNIINVSVEGGVSDTSKAPSEILSLLKQSDYNETDTTGTAQTESTLMGKLDSVLTDVIIEMNGDSLNKKANDIYNSYGSIKDTILTSAISDSMGRWSEAITNNGVITGQGSDNCPNVLTRTWRVDFPIGNSHTSVTIGPLGNYMCNEVAGMGITFWGLCRVLLRAMVAIGCMIWLYKAVLGIDGGSNEED